MSRRDTYARGLQLRVTPDQRLHLESLARILNARTSNLDTATSHRRLTGTRLLQLLLEDAVLAHDRPGSWEGAGILDQLRRHGYVP